MGLLSRHRNPTGISMRQREKDLGWMNLGSHGYYNPHGLDYQITREKEEEQPPLRCRLFGHKWQKKAYSWMWYCGRRHWGKNDKPCTAEEKRYIAPYDGDWA